MTLRLLLTCSVLVVAVMVGGQVFAANASLCVTIADPAARLVCYDAALKPLPATAPAPIQHAATASVAAPSVSAGTTVAAAAPAKESRLSSMFGLQPKTDRSNAAKLRLEATVIDVMMRPSGQIITLDNEQVWQITEDLRDPFVKIHDAIVINPASLGSFQMMRAKGGGAVRVKRLR
jgi:hypothetical protein